MVRIARILRWLTLGTLVLTALALSGVDAHPVEMGGSCSQPGPEHAYKLWVSEWAKAPLDPSGEGLHKFNSIGCVDDRVY